MPICFFSIVDLALLRQIAFTQPAPDPETTRRELAELELPRIEVVEPPTDATAGAPRGPVFIRPVAAPPDCSPPGRQDLLERRLLLTAALKRECSHASESDRFVEARPGKLVVEEYETRFAEPISMDSSLLPPIGFVATVCGLARLLFYSMHMSQAMLQLGGFAMALSSTTFALIGYAILESLKLQLYGRLARSIDAVLRLEA